MSTTPGATASSRTITLVLGFTEANREADYAPSSDGWRAEAEQSKIRVRLGVEALDLDPTVLAEACYAATNDPTAARQGGLVGVVYDQVKTRRMAIELTLNPRDPENDWDEALRSMSVGDSVALVDSDPGLDADGNDAANVIWLLTCERMGWQTRIDRRNQTRNI